MTNSQFAPALKLFVPQVFDIIVKLITSLNTGVEHVNATPSPEFDNVKI